MGAGVPASLQNCVVVLRPRWVCSIHTYSRQNKKGRMAFFVFVNKKNLKDKFDFIQIFADDAVGLEAGFRRISLRKYVIIMLLTMPW